jgi:hypothetical protein
MSGGDTESLFAQCQSFALAYSELRGEINRLLVTSQRSPQSTQSLAQANQLAGRVQTLDRDIANWLASIPDEFRFKTVGWVFEDEIGISRGRSYAEVEVFPGRVDVYPDFVTAMVWNIARVSRLILASLNIRLAAWVCAPTHYRTTPEYEDSARICEDTITDIVASVPYHLGCQIKGKPLVSPGLSAFACGEEGPCKALPALFLVWTLTCVKNHDISTDEQRAWAKGRLKFIADDVGLKYANIVNEVRYALPVVSAVFRSDTDISRSTSASPP